MRINKKIEMDLSHNREGNNFYQLRINMNNSMSLYIPHVFSNISRERITKAVEHLGTVRSIDLVGKTGKDGKRYNAAYIHFENWHDSVVTRNFQERLTTGDRKARIIYDDPWFWIVLENNSTAAVSRTQTTAANFAPKKNKESRAIASLRTNLTALFDAVAVEDEEMDCVPEESFELVDAKYVEVLEREIVRLNGLLRRELERSF